MKRPTSDDEAPMLMERNDRSSPPVVSTDRLPRLFRDVVRNSGHAEPLAVDATQDPLEDLVPPDETVCYRFPSASLFDDLRRTDFVETAGHTVHC